jgi:hypothetical protein
MSSKPAALAPPPAHRFLCLRLLRISLVAGALYDLGFAALMVLNPQLPARLFDLPLPQEAFYLWILATLLAMLGLLYLAAALEPRRYSAVIVVAILGRFLGAAAFALAARGRPELAGLWPLAGVDLVFSLAHGAFWLPLRR